MKVTSLLLSVPKHGITKMFTVEHAERLLRMPCNGGWQLPKDSPYEFDPETGLRLKPKKNKTNSPTE